MKKRGNALPVVGQEMFALNIGNEARGREQKLVPVVVTKVGHKYFTCENGYGHARTYHLGTFVEKTGHCAGSMIYADPVHWEEDKEAAALEKELRTAFSGYSLKISLAGLREIKAVIDRERGAVSCFPVE